MFWCYIEESDTLYSIRLEIKKIELGFAVMRGDDLLNVYDTLNEAKNHVEREHFEHLKKWNEANK